MKGFVETALKTLHSNIKNINGNALFLILIAVALFAALSYAITQSARGEGSIDREQAEIGVARLLQYFSQIELAIQRMRVIGGIPLERIDFVSPLRVNGDGSPTSSWDNSLCTNAECELFNSAGGGLNYLDFEKLASKTPSSYPVGDVKAGHNQIIIANVEGVGTDLPEVIIRIMAMDRAFCHAINRKAGLPNEPAYSVGGETFYAMGGDPSLKLIATDAWTFGNDFPDLIGQHSFCLTSGTPKYHIVYHVLVVR